MARTIGAASQFMEVATMVPSVLASFFGLQLASPWRFCHGILVGPCSLPGKDELCRDPWAPPRSTTALNGISFGQCGLVFSLTFTGNHILLGFLADGHDFPMTLNMSSSSSSSSNPACPSPAAFCGLCGDVNYCIVCSLRRPNSHLMSTRFCYPRKSQWLIFNPWVNFGLSQQNGG